MSAKRNQQEFEISQQLSGVFYITCSKCYTHTKLMAEDANEAACGFYEKGWRTKNQKLLCRKCVRSCAC
jgi:hypothetical protein